MERPERVILIGGASHAGKSTLAGRLAEQLGWTSRSTDCLANIPDDRGVTRQTLCRPMSASTIWTWTSTS